jgi:hypothetical protein
MRRPTTITAAHAGRRASSRASRAYASSSLDLARCESSSACRRRGNAGDVWGMGVATITFALGIFANLAALLGTRRLVATLCGARGGRFTVGLKLAVASSRGAPLSHRRGRSGGLLSRRRCPDGFGQRADSARTARVTRLVVRPEAHVCPFVPLLMNVYSTNRTVSALLLLPCSLSRHLT